MLPREGKEMSTFFGRVVVHSSLILTSLGGQGCEPAATSDSGTFTQEGNVHTLVIGDLSMSIDASTGARVVSFQVKGVESLVQEGDASQYGTTFWPSPQIWSWPPEGSIGEIDQQPYTVSDSQDALTFESQFNSTFGVVVQKTLRADKGRIAIDYTVQNAGEETIEVAPWEINRIAAGIVFYPTGPDGIVTSGLPLEYVGPNSWYEYNAEGLSGVPKNSEDGAEGWLAIAVPGAGDSGALVVKSFEDIDLSQFAPNHGEVEIYADPSGGYMEVEQQGAYVEVAAGKALRWTVLWNGIPIETGTDWSVGSQDLLSLAQDAL
jgi:hypothetical protein